MPYHKIASLTEAANGPVIHYSVCLDDGATVTITRRVHACSPEVGDLVWESGSVNGVPSYECLRPPMTGGDNQIFNRLLAAIPEPGYWHYRVIASLATANNGRIMIRTKQENEVCQELFRAGAIGKIGCNPEWAFCR